MNTILASSLPAKKFVDPDACNIPFQDIAQQNVTNLLKNDNNWVLKQSLGQIGWRTKKNYFKVQVKNSNVKQNQSSKLESQASTSSYKDPADEYLLSWTEFGHEKSIRNDKEFSGVLKSLMKIKHPHIVPIEFIQSNENGCLVIQKFYPNGSLKDILCASSPLNLFNSKYGNPKGRFQLPLADIALYSRQILEAVKYLHTIGLAHGHISTANIFIDTENKVARIGALENYVIGVNSFYRPFLVQNSKVTSLELIDIFIFGHLLFEMQSSYSLQEPYAREITECPSSLKSLLELLITKDSFKPTAPTFDKITSHAFFQEFAKSYETKHSTLKQQQTSSQNFDTASKEFLIKLSQKCEQKLKDEQKLVKSQKRSLASQNQKHLNEEEKRKNKTRLKSQSSLQNSQNQNGMINFKINISEELHDPEPSTAKN